MYDGSTDIARERESKGVVEEVIGGDYRYIYDMLYEQIAATPGPVLQTSHPLYLTDAPCRVHSYQRRSIVLVPNIPRSPIRYGCTPFERHIRKA